MCSIEKRWLLMWSCLMVNIWFLVLKNNNSGLFRALLTGLAFWLEWWVISEPSASISWVCVWHVESLNWPYVSAKLTQEELTTKLCWHSVASIETHQIWCIFMYLWPWRLSKSKYTVVHILKKNCHTLNRFKCFTTLQLCWCTKHWNVLIVMVHAST